MSPFSSPSLVLPEPLRAAEKPSFTYHSVAVRLPEIARRMLAENNFPQQTAARIQALIDEIPNGAIRPIDTPHAPDQAQWQTWVQPYLGQNWLEVPWFFAEEYFYRSILEATGYFAEGPRHAQDPYAHQKKLGLESSRGEIRALADYVQTILQAAPETYRDALGQLLTMDLWGNQKDLSMWPVSQSADAPANGNGNGAAKNGKSHLPLGQHAPTEHILTNQIPETLAFINRLDPSAARLDFLLDNAGYELVMDLALADFLLASGHAAHITLHAKAYPVFVSDAIEKDIHSTIDYLTLDEHPSVQAMGIRLRERLIQRRLTLHQHPFWTSPLPAWEMPADLAAEIGAADLLIAKGDANYRRLLGDRHWQLDVPFSEVVSYMPCPVLALRTLKSEIAVGIQPASIPTGDAEWMIDGKWGLIEFARSGGQG